MDNGSPVIGFVGGAGEMGRGLAFRFATSGFPVMVGSRAKERAQAAAKELSELAGREVRGLSNEEMVAAADYVFLCVPYQVAAEFVADLKETLSQKVVVSIVNPLVRRKGYFLPAYIEGRSAAEAVADACGARVIGAFHHVPARALLDARSPLYHVMVAGDDEALKAEFISMIEKTGAFKGFNAGPLAVCRALEAMTAALLNINKAHAVESWLEIKGI